LFSGNFDGEDITKGKDEGIMKRIKENGEGFDHPNVSCSIAENAAQADQGSML
jgi:hypothetical protein